MRQARITLPALERQLAAAIDARLPGLDAQLRMAPRPRVGWDPHRIPPGLRDGAALVLLYPRVPLAHASDAATAEPHVLLTLRGSGLRKHTGQVSFPGGAVDAGESFETAALREAQEEVGLNPNDVRVLGGLTPVHIPVSGFLLHPVVGVVDRRPEFRIAEREVARLLEVPVTTVADPGIVRWQQQTRQLAGQTIPVDVPYFDIDGEVVWGATAMILAELLAATALAPPPAQALRPE